MRKLFLLGAFIMASVSLSATEKNATLVDNNLTVESIDLLAPTCYVIVYINGNPV